MTQGQPSPPPGEILLYLSEDGRTRVECRFVDESLWLSQALIAELFQVSVPTVHGHLTGIYEDGELDPGPTIRSFRIVRREGTREVVRAIEHYNLDAILAVGYRVRSDRGTQFRRWATERLKAPRTRCASSAAPSGVQGARPRRRSSGGRVRCLPVGADSPAPWPRSASSSRQARRAAGAAGS